MITLPQPPTPGLQPLQPPLPRRMKHLAGLDAPLHLCRGDVAVLLEFWGFTRNGEEFLKKLVKCEVISPVKLAHQNNARYLTRQVLAVWETEKQ